MHKAMHAYALTNYFNIYIHTHKKSILHTASYSMKWGLYLCACVGSMKDILCVYAYIKMYHG